MTTADPRRNPYGEAAMRPTRSGISDSSRPSWLSMICATGSRSVGDQSPSDERGTVSRRA